MPKFTVQNNLFLHLPASMYKNSVLFNYSDMFPESSLKQNIRTKISVAIDLYKK